MTETSDRSWVWRSTKESRKAELVSVLAVAETLVCVALYWVLWFWSGVTWHHWLILIATPLVLLRSKQSVAMGFKWYNADIDPAFIEKPNSLIIKIIMGLCVFLVGGVAWGLATICLADSQDWLLCGKVLVLAAIAPSFVVAALRVALAAQSIALGSDTPESVPTTSRTSGSREETVPRMGSQVSWATVLIVALTPGMFFGDWVVALIVRFAATARHLCIGVHRFPTNWRFSALVSDVWHPPELVPGKTYRNYDEIFRSYSSQTRYHKLPLNHLLVISIGSVIFVFPAMLWRGAIKSTAWFYIPLLWARRGWLSHEGDELRLWANTYSNKAQNWFWLIGGGLSLTALTVGLFSLEKWKALKQTTGEVDAPMGLIAFLWSLNWIELLAQPWLWFLIPSYLLTIRIFFALDSIAVEIRDIVANNCDPALLLPRAAKIRGLKWEANARAVLTNIGLALMLWYFLGALDAWGQVQDFFSQWF